MSTDIFIPYDIVRWEIFPALDDKTLQGMLKSDASDPWFIRKFVLPACARIPVEKQSPALSSAIILAAVRTYSDADAAEYLKRYCHGVGCCTVTWDYIADYNKRLVALHFANMSETEAHYAYANVIERRKTGLLKDLLEYSCYDPSLIHYLRCIVGGRQKMIKSMITYLKKYEYARLWVRNSISEFIPLQNTHIINSLYNEPVATYVDQIGELIEITDLRDMLLSWYEDDVWDDYDMHVNVW